MGFHDGIRHEEKSLVGLKKKKVQVMLRVCDNKLKRVDGK